jgi:Uma2 family endonuclease
MATVATTPVTVESFSVFVSLPENADRWFELERGEIIELPPPKKPHGIVCGNVARILGNYAVSIKTGYVTTNDAGYITERSPDSVRGPDIAYWVDQDAISPEAPQYTDAPPVVAVEVLSPDDRINRLLRKVGEYLNSGVQQVWIIDPVSRDVAIHQRGVAPLFLSERDELSGGETLPGFQCAVADLFQALTVNEVT